MNRATTSVAFEICYPAQMILDPVAILEFLCFDFLSRANEKSHNVLKKRLTRDRREKSRTTIRGTCNVRKMQLRQNCSEKCASVKKIYKRFAAWRENPKCESSLITVASL